MKGNVQVLQALNLHLTAELTSLNQHYIHAKMCVNWGFAALASKHRKVSIDEMKRADDLIERILLLEGIPNLQRYDTLTVGETPKEQLELDLVRDQVIVRSLNDAVALCVASADNGTRELFEDLTIKHEAHVDWLETQLHLIETVGEQGYLAEQM